MSLIKVTYLDVLHELCLQHGYALLLTARHQPAAFAKPSRTELRSLDVVKPETETADGLTIRPRGRSIRAGDLVARCRLDAVDNDLQAAAELLAGLVARDRQRP